MTRDEAERMAREARECPFCGERLLLQCDGREWYATHKHKEGKCFLSDCHEAEIHDDIDLQRWNTRATSEREKQFAAALQEITRRAIDRLTFVSDEELPDFGG